MLRLNERTVVVVAIRMVVAARGESAAAAAEIIRAEISLFPELFLTEKPSSLKRKKATKKEGENVIKKPAKQRACRTLCRNATWFYMCFYYLFDESKQSCSSAEMMMMLLKKFLVIHENLLDS